MKELFEEFRAGLPAQFRREFFQYLQQRALLGYIQGDFGFAQIKSYSSEKLDQDSCQGLLRKRPTAKAAGPFF